MSDFEEYYDEVDYMAALEEYLEKEEMTAREVEERGGVRLLKSVSHESQQGGDSKQLQYLTS